MGGHQVANNGHSAQRIAAAEALAPTDQTEMDTLMRRLLDQSRAPVAEGTAPEGAPADRYSSPPKRDFDMASELLDRASQAFDILLSRCQRLEHEVGEANDRAEARAAEQDAAVAQWQRVALGFKAQLETAEQGAAAMKARCDAAEARAAMAEQRASALERASAQAASQAALAENASTKLHDKVVSAFGIGSRAHPVLEAVATRIAAE